MTGDEQLVIADMTFMAVEMTSFPADVTFFPSTMNFIPISENSNTNASSGQAYVALSRATSLDGLQVLNFDENKVRVHPKVVEWVKTLETIKC